MSVISGTTKTLPNLTAITEIGNNDLIYVELSGGGSRKMTFADLLASITGGSTSVNWGDVVSVQTNDGTKIPTASLVYAMNETLTVAAREQQCINGSRERGIEWDVDELMVLVRNGDFDKFAIGDYITDPSTSTEWAIAAKNHYPLWAFNVVMAARYRKHIVLMPTTQLATMYKFNNTSTNTGGYAGSLMPANMETEFAKLSPTIRDYCKTTRIYENNKGTWAAADRYMRLPTVAEVFGHHGMAGTEMYSNGAPCQLPLCKSNIFKYAVSYNRGYWLLDPSSFTTSAFCLCHSRGMCEGNGNTTESSAANSNPVRPLIVLA